MTLTLKDLVEKPELLDDILPSLSEEEVEDEHYACLGEEIERHPIVSGGIRRGP